MKIFSSCILIAVFFLTACRGQKETVNNYLQNKDTTGRTLVRLPEPVIKKGDLLSIRVFSASTKPELDIPYNMNEQTIAGTNNTVVAGFLVEPDGTIQYPQVGSIKAEGLTRTELAQLIKSKISDKLINPSVLIRFVNYRITVIGEVNTPGTFTVPTERITILEAMGLAGDVTDFGSRKNIQVAREVDGQVEIGRVDLTSSDLFMSPYFRLQQNDVIMVEQTRRKLQQQEQQNTAQQIGIATSIITTIAIIFNIFK